MERVLSRSAREAGVRARADAPLLPSPPSSASGGRSTTPADLTTQPARDCVPGTRKKTGSNHPPTKPWAFDYAPLKAAPVPHQTQRCYAICLPPCRRVRGFAPSLASAGRGGGLGRGQLQQVWPPLIPTFPRKRGKEQVLPQISNSYCHPGRAGRSPCRLEAMRASAARHLCRTMLRNQILVDRAVLVTQPRCPQQAKSSDCSL
jgi:hypothetical protein